MHKNMIIILALPAIVCGCGARLHTDVPLVWKPTSDLSSGASTLTGMYAERFNVFPFTDKRDNKKEIARNVEDSTERLVTTRDDVAAWCTDRFKSILKQYGLNVDAQGTVSLKGEILNFHVTEENVYRANVGIKIIAERPDGAVLWQGVVTGNAKRFGRSYSLENYYESISDAYLEAVTRLLSDAEFKKSLKQPPHGA